MKKYRILSRLSDVDPETPYYVAQVKTHFGVWVDIKSFFDPEDPDYARFLAYELLEKLQEEC